MTPLGDCAARVRAHDHDRFLCTLFAPEAVRGDLFALYAFNLELAKIRETVSEPLIGRMRLQFWRDAVPGIVGGEPPRHDIAGPLSAAVGRAGIDADALTRLIDARETDLDGVGIADMDAMTAYADGTSSALMAMAFRICGVAPGDHADFIRDAGIAVGLVGAARAIAYQASTGRVTLPADLCAAHGFDVSAPHQWAPGADFSAIARPLVDAAAERLNAARRAWRRPRPALAAALPLSLTGLYLAQLLRAGADARRLHARPPGVSRHLTLLWRAASGRP